MSNVQYKPVKDHIEVYEDGEFIFSEDTKTAAMREYDRGYCSHLGKYCDYEECENCDFIQPHLIGEEY